MDKKKIKIVFMGTSEFAVPVLENLQENFNVELVVTMPDKPAGRSQQLQASPIKKVATRLGLKIEQPGYLKNNRHFMEQLEKIGPHVIVVVAYGKILPLEILNLPEHGCLNIHGSLLPKYRGATPIQSVLANGEKITGISIILMDQGMDTGDIVAKETIQVEETDYYQGLSYKLSCIAAKKIDEILIPYIRGDITLEMQDDDDATYAYRIMPDSGKIRWVQSARAILNRIRALADNQGSYALWQGKRLNIIRAGVCVDDSEDQEIQVGKVMQCPKEKDEICVKCGKNYLMLKEIQLEGKRIMSVNDFINGHHDFIDSILK